VTYTPPEKIGKWLRVNRLGNGAFGDAWVYADSTAKNEYAVIKFLFHSEEPITETKKRFKKERDILSKLDNPRVCRLLDADLDFNPPWIATELFGGRPLKAEISKTYQLDEFEWVRLANDVLEGLTYVHSLNIKHRDLNPGNIVKAAAGYRIIDFGISSQGQAQGTYSGNQRIFHRLYGSPEMYDLNQQVSEKSDVFSLATLLVFAATHRSPWSTDERVSSDKEVTQGIFQEVAYNIQKSEPEYYGMSTNQKMLLRRMHEKDPAKRLSAEDALKELKKLSDREFVNYLAAGAPKRPAKSGPVKVVKQQITPSAPKKKPNIIVSGNRVQVVEGSAHIDPAKLTISGNSVQVETDGPLEKILRNRKEQTQKERFQKQQAQNQSLKFAESIARYSKLVDFISKYWKDLLIGWLTTPIGWLIYRARKNSERPTVSSRRKKTVNLKSWKVGFLITHGLSFGFLGPIAGIPLAYHFKKPFTLMFVTINFFAVLTFLSAIISTPEGSEAATSATIIWILNYILGFFLPRVMKYDAKDSRDQSLEESKKDKYDNKSYDKNEDKTATDKIDPFDDEEYFANAQAKLQKEPKKKSWNELRDEVTEILHHSGIERFNVEFAQADISGIYFQGFLEKSGCITIEAAANLSVRPEITSEQNRNIIRAGWEPPAGENPNYIKFLDLTQSNLEFIAELMISTLRDGYGASIDGLEPVFSVSMGGEIIYVDFAEFKRLTSQ
jgi:serine/threonine protein kinase